MSYLTSKVSRNCQTAIPKRVREMLGIKEGDHIRYDIVGGQVMLNRLDADGVVNPVSGFAEWAGDADATAFARL